MDGAGAGVGVPHPEEGVALALHEVVGADAGPVMGGGVQQGPASGVGAEGGGVLRGGEGTEDQAPVADGQRSRRRGRRWSRTELLVLDFDPAALRGDDAGETVGEDFGAYVVGDADDEDAPGEEVGVPVSRPFLQHALHEAGAGAAVESDVEEAGAGDLDVTDAGGVDEVGPEHFGDAQRGLPGGPGELEGDVGGVVAVTAGPGGSDGDAPREVGEPVQIHGEVPGVDGTPDGVQHGAGELDGGHGTRVGEEGGGKASRFEGGPGMWDGVMGRSRATWLAGDRLGAGTGGPSCRPGWGWCWMQRRYWDRHRRRCRG
ncbi:hypothetical protein GCM10010335_42360 [Streptomyces galbus]|nr:hypothetical protein GCM10010335_42360 [Streptomyces galbus]